MEKRGPLGFKMGPIRRWLAQRETLIKRPKFFKNPPSGSSEYLVKYIDLTTGRTKGPTKFTEREMYDFYKQQREGKVSVVSIHKVASHHTNSNPNGILIDTRTISREEAINVIARSEWAQNLATGWLKAFVPDLTPGTPKYEETKWRIARRVSAGVI